MLCYDLVNCKLHGLLSKSPLSISTSLILTQVSLQFKMVQNKVDGFIGHRVTNGIHVVDGITKMNSSEKSASAAVSLKLGPSLDSVVQVLLWGEPYIINRLKPSSTKLFKKYI